MYNEFWCVSGVRGSSILADSAGLVIELSLFSSGGWVCCCLLVLGFCCCFLRITVLNKFSILIAASCVAVSSLSPESLVLNSVLITCLTNCSYPERRPQLLLSACL